MYDTISKCECCDCGASITFKFCLLVEGFKFVSIATCSTCKDGRSVRATGTLSKKVYWAAALSGVPIVRYG